MIDQPIKVPADAAARKALAHIIDRRYRRTVHPWYWCPEMPRLPRKIVDALRRDGFVHTYEVDSTVYVKVTREGIDAVAAMRARSRATG